MEKGERYFQGRIWVDDQDFQIVKTYGETVPQVHNAKHPEKENLSPKFTTWRAADRRRVLVPGLHLADDTLHFSGSEDVKHALHREVQELQAVRSEVEDHLRRAGSVEEKTRSSHAQQPNPDQHPPKQ